MTYIATLAAPGEIAATLFHFWKDQPALLTAIVMAAIFGGDRFRPTPRFVGPQRGFFPNSVVGVACR